MIARISSYTIYGVYKKQGPEAYKAVDKHPGLCHRISPLEVLPGVRYDVANRDTAQQRDGNKRVYHSHKSRRIAYTHKDGRTQAEMNAHNNQVMGDVQSEGRKCGHLFSILFEKKNVFGTQEDKLHTEMNGNEQRRVCRTQRQMRSG